MPNYFRYLYPLLHLRYPIIHHSRSRPFTMFFFTIYPRPLDSVVYLHFLFVLFVANTSET